MPSFSSSRSKIHGGREHTPSSQQGRRCGYHSDPLARPSPIRIQTVFTDNITAVRPTTTNINCCACLPSPRHTVSTETCSTEKRRQHTSKPVPRSCLTSPSTSPGRRRCSAAAPRHGSAAAAAAAGARSLSPARARAPGLAARAAPAAPTRAASRSLCP